MLYPRYPSFTCTRYTRTKHKSRPILTLSKHLFPALKTSTCNNRGDFSLQRKPLVPSDLLLHSMDTAQWPQEIMLKPVEEMIEPNKCLKPGLERKVRPQREQALNCPRCNSTNTKFCYYNNYSLSQPRYFCKTCRRYWTEGGSLRNIPVGGGSRKNKRSSSSSSSKKVPDQLVPPTSSASQNPKTTHEGQDLNLGFLSHDFKAISDLIQVPNLELLNGISSRGLMSSLMPLPSNSDNPSAIFSSGFSLQELNKTNLNFSPDGYEGLNQNFPFEDLKQISSTSEVEQCKGQGDSTGYWNGVLGGGSW